MTVYEWIKSMTKEQLAMFIAIEKGSTFVGAEKLVYFGGFGLSKSEDVPFYKNYLEELKDLDAEVDPDDVDTLNELIFGKPSSS